MSTPINGTPNSEFEVFEPDLAGIRANIASVLSDPDASAFVKDLLGRVSSESNPLVEDGDLLRIFDKLTGPGQGGVLRGPIGGGRMDGSFQQGNAKILLAGIDPTTLPDKKPEYLKEFQLWSDSDKIIHELCHASGLLSYSDFQLAVAVSQMENAPPLPDIPKLTENSTPEERTHAAVVPSRYWNKVLKEHCKSTPPPAPPGMHFGTSEL
jgi:hypothetical protein